VYIQKKRMPLLLSNASAVNTVCICSAWMRANHKHLGQRYLRDQVRLPLGFVVHDGHPTMARLTSLKKEKNTHESQAEVRTVYQTHSACSLKNLGKEVCSSSIDSKPVK
jgi:hypothetical protein